MTSNSPPPSSFEDGRAARAWFELLRDRLCTAFEEVEREASGAARGGLPPGAFVRTPWERPAEDGIGDPGGGTMAILRGGVFEKVGVNVSAVQGVFSEAFRTEIPGAAEDPRFFATGVSVVAHMRSPLVPAAHMNTRFIRTTAGWFGGGADLTPTYPRDADTRDFHAALEAACDGYREGAYAEYRAWCDRYFFLPHRGEPRGVGGIFFDRLGAGFEADFAFARAVGEAFLEVFPRIVRRSMEEPWTGEQRAFQLRRRGRYVEFNLLHDRGTRFGIQTGGNPEAVLMSLPPLAAWP